MWCDVINCGCDTLYSVSDVKDNWLQGHIYKGCDTMERVGVRHRYSACDDTNIVIMLFIQWI